MYTYSFAIIPAAATSHRLLLPTSTNEFSLSGRFPRTPARAHYSMYILCIQRKCVTK